MRFNKSIKILFSVLTIMLFTVASVCAEVALPNINVSMSNVKTPEEFTTGLQILIWLTVLTLAPSIIIMTTSFVRIIIVLALARQAIGTSNLPPNQVLAGLAIILTFFIMTPTFNKINETALQPYINHQITQQTAIDKGLIPVREFMIKQLPPEGGKEVELFISMAKIERPKSWQDAPTYIILPSFILNELKTAFKIGFMIFLPFLIIDIVIASILVSMGMMFLPPAVVSTPFKLILFVMIDGWYLLTESLVKGFM